MQAASQRCKKLEAVQRTDRTSRFDESIGHSEPREKTRAGGKTYQIARDTRNTALQRHSRAEITVSKNKPNCKGAADSVSEAFHVFQFERANK